MATIAVEGGKLESMTNPTSGPGASGHAGDSYPALSPDGRRLAFVRGGEVTTSLDDVYVLTLDGRQQPGGEARKLIGGLQAIHGLAWAPDGRSLFVSSVRNSARRISRVRVTDGALEPIGVGVSGASQPFISAGSRRMAFVWEQHDTDIFRVPGPGWKPADGPPPAAQPVVASIYDDTTPSYSADGKRIAFDSEATGHQEIWVADADGRNAVPITSFNGPPVGTPRWSPDGSRIAFDSRKNGNGDIFVIDAGGGAPMQLTSEPSSESRPTWSSDGKFIFFYSDRTGRIEIWKAPSGGGAAVQFTSNGGENPRTVPGEPWVYYSWGNELWRMPEAGGTPEKILDSMPGFNWAPYHGGIAAYNFKALAIWPKGAAGWQKLRDLPGVSPNFFRAPTLSLTADEKWVAMHLTTLDRADLLLVENVR